MMVLRNLTGRNTKIEKFLRINLSDKLLMNVTISDKAPKDYKTGWNKKIIKTLKKNIPQIKRLLEKHRVWFKPRGGVIYVNKFSIIFRIKTGDELSWCH
jgi:hypothetical protein